MILKIIAALLLLCGTLMAGHYKSLLAVELAAATMRENPAPDGGGDKVPRSKCTVCGGTGKVKAGDGRTVVWRECDNCYDDSKKACGCKPKCECKETGKCECGSKCECPDCPSDCQCQVATQARQLLIFTAKWCVPCQRLKGKELKPSNARDAAPLQKLMYAGWKVGGLGNIRLVDVDEEPKMAQAYKIEQLPAYVMVNGHGKELGRMKPGLYSDRQIVEFFDYVVKSSVQ